MASLIKQYVELTSKYQRLEDMYKDMSREKNIIQRELDKYKQLNDENVKVIETLKQKVNELTTRLVNEIQKKTSVEPQTVSDALKLIGETHKDEIYEEQPVEEPVTETEDIIDTYEESESSESEVDDEPVRKSRKPRKSRKKIENNED